MNISLIEARESNTSNDVRLFGNPAVKPSIDKFRSIIKDYPQWEASLFDEYFFCSQSYACNQALSKGQSTSKRQ